MNFFFEFSAGHSHKRLPFHEFLKNKLKIIYFFHVVMKKRCSFEYFLDIVINFLRKSFLHPSI